MKEKILLFLLFMVALGTCFNLGSYERISESKFSGGKASFEILLWTSDEENIFIDIKSVENPSGWNISINPERAVINRTTGSEIITINTGYAYATVLKVEAVTSGESSYGEIKIVASAFSKGDNINSVQERVFRLKAFGNNSYENSTENIITQLNEYGNDTVEMYGNQSENLETTGSDQGTNNIIGIFILCTSIIILLLCAIKIIKERDF